MFLTGRITMVLLSATSEKNLEKDMSNRQLKIMSIGVTANFRGKVNG